MNETTKAYPELTRAILSDGRQQGVIGALAHMREEVLTRTLKGARKIKLEEAFALTRALRKPFQQLFPEVADLLSDAMHYEDMRMGDA